MAFIGIDLGTTTSEAAVFDEDEESARILRDERGNEIVESYVGIDPKTNKTEVGEKVKSTFQSNPDNTVEQVKRHMDEEETEFTLGAGVTESEVLSPEEVSAHILRHLKKSAEGELGEEVDRCVITVPANFPEPARQATRRAGKIAGMTVERIMSEPTAAALSYGYDKNIEKEYVMVYDLGGGTFDVSIVKHRGDVFDVEASSGDTNLGGKDFDEVLLWHVAEKFKEKHGITIEPESGNYYRLLFECEAAKKELSFNRRTSVHIPFFTVKDGDSVDLDVEVSRSTFERLISDKIDATEASIDKALEDAKLSPSDIDRIILVGGSTRIPYVQQHVEEVMGQSSNNRIDPDKAVALGAAVQSAIIDGIADPVIMDVCPLSLGTAAVAIEQGRAKPGQYEEIIEPNSDVLEPHSQEFFTMHEAQDAIEFRVYQRDNKSMSEQAEINGEPNEEEGFHQLRSKFIKLPKSGQQKIEVKYVFTPDGILNVTVCFPEAGKKVELKAETTEEELEESRKKVREGNVRKIPEEEYKDSEYYEKVEPLLRSAENQLEEGLEPEKQEEVRSLVKDIKRALAANDGEKVEVLEEEITEVLFELS